MLQSNASLPERERKDDAAPGLHAAASSRCASASQKAASQANEAMGCRAAALLKHRHRQRQVWVGMWVLVIG